jgi:signal peptidase II
MKINFLFLFALTLSIVSDLGSKFYLLYWYLQTGYYPDISALFGGFFRIDLALNKGGIFNLFEDRGEIFLYINCAAILFFLILYLKSTWKNTLFIFASGLITGGLLANFIDRLIHKGVIGFISIEFFPQIIERWPIFNFADFWIIFGGALVFLVYLYESSRGNSRSEGELESV